MGRPAALEALLDLLPADGEPFPAAAREMWTRAFSSILDVTYGAAPAAAPTTPSQAATQQPSSIPAAPTPQPAKRGPGRPAGSLPGDAKAHADGSVTCPVCGKRPATADAYRQHWRRYHSAGVAHISGPPPKPAPTFAPAPAAVPDPEPQPVTSVFEARARDRAIEAAFG